MSTCACSATVPGVTILARPQRGMLSRLSSAGAWLLPGFTLAFMPKCPVCVAGYLAMLTGTSISFTTAGWLRTGLITFCVMLLGWLVLRKVRQLFTKESVRFLP